MRSLRTFKKEGAVAGMVSAWTALQGPRGGRGFLLAYGCVPSSLWTVCSVAALAESSLAPSSLPCDVAGGEWYVPGILGCLFIQGA